MHLERFCSFTRLSSPAIKGALLPATSSRPRGLAPTTCRCSGGQAAQLFWEEPDLYNENDSVWLKKGLIQHNFNLFMIHFMIVSSNRLGQGASFSFWPRVSTLFHWEYIGKTKKNGSETKWLTPPGLGKGPKKKKNQNVNYFENTFWFFLFLSQIFFLSSQNL